MDPFEALLNLLLLFGVSMSAILSCLPFVLIAVVLVAGIWWFQTLMLCLQQETGPDKTTYVLIIVMLGPLGALVYRLVRTSSDEGSLYSFRPIRNEHVPAPRRPARRTGYSTGQVVLIAVGSSLVGIVLCCGSLLTFSAWYEPPPILTARAATAQAPGPGIIPTSFSFDMTPVDDGSSILATMSAISTQSAEVMMTGAAP